jgi:RNA polymerase sigma-70 factor (ECF subfamily)
MVEEPKIQELIAEAQGGNSEAFGRIYDLYAAKLFNFLLSKVRHKQTSEDLLHTVFLKAWDNLNSYQPRPTAKFSTWLFQIANFTLIDFWRTKKDTVELTKVENLSDFALDPDLFEDYEFLWIALSQLPLEYQTILDLRFKQQLSVSETALIMDKSQVSVRVMQHRALKLLKNILNKDGITEL